MPKATGKNHAEINLDIWGDEPWMDLTPLAQHLYFVLWTSPQLSYCGSGEWKPAKIATRARGWTRAAVEAAAAELSRELFLIVDADTEEYLLRSWIKHDGIWRKPNMAVSMANARADLASRTLRGVIVHEVRKIREREPNVAGWDRDAVKNLLSQRAIDPAELPPFTPTATPVLTNGFTPALTPDLTPALTLSGGVGVNPPADPGPTPTPAPFSSSISPEGLHNRGTSPGRTASDPNAPQPPRCLDHIDDPSPPPCGRCAEARKAAEALERSLHAAREATRREFLAEIADCDACDEHGWEIPYPDDGDARRCAKHDWSLSRD
ncbi:hypothetical protein [Mycobacterium sp. NAZ190054]|uniref:hypothetical protein n=1 Tax=Mycobacterium sp. NAZ190054 TaxID=1747766 RepID=UPI000794D1CC|nr:hypothetical protein [Mycobacterium sp. NAZ190054]KWX66826.1 hypothetical protein ASJ79_05530 [Mycobacterium sp. NAZ190054]